MTEESARRQPEPEELHLQAELLSRFFPGLAVYLRTALSSLYLAVDALVGEDARDFNPTLDRNLAVLDQNYYRLLRLVGNLNLSAELERPMEPPREDRDIVAEAAEVCQKADSLARLLGLTLRFRCRKSSHLCALRRGAVREMLMQLLSNAFKFTPSGGQVTVTLDIGGGWVSLQVSDSGRGIPEERMHTLFDRYLRSEGGELPPYGLGLGLPICRRLAQSHGGRVLAESREGKGSRVTVLLPDRQTGTLALSDQPIDYTGGFNPTLLGLADALPAAAFRAREK